MIPDLLIDGPADAPLVIALAHGAGAGMESPFMARMAEGLAGRGFRVARFEFPYMAERRCGGTRRPPDRTPVLIEAWREAARTIAPAERLVVGGKSLGGRIASLIADGIGARGLLCLGYPFHAAGRRASSNNRVEHLRRLRTPALILQGTRDPFGGPDEVAGYDLSPAIRLHWLPDGDHGFKPRKSSGRGEEQNLAEAVDAAARFLGSLRCPE